MQVNILCTWLTVIERYKFIKPQNNNYPEISFDAPTYNLSYTININLFLLLIIYNFVMLLPFLPRNLDQGITFLPFNLDIAFNVSDGY